MENIETRILIIESPQVKYAIVLLYSTSKICVKKL